MTHSFFRVSILLLASLFIWMGVEMSQPNLAAAKTKVRALWVECEGTNDTLSSKEKIIQMLNIAKENKFNLVYVQIFRGHRAWFKSRLAPDGPYQKFLKKEKTDMLQFLINEAHRRGIEVHGWMNQLRVVRNKQKKYPVIERLGRDVVTRNGRGVSLWDFPYEKLPDGGLWLDPGSLKVQKFLGDIAAELVNEYPEIDGVHLDFVRIPFDVPYAGSRWDGGKGFGYGKESVARFKRKTGLNPMNMEKTRENTQKWDDWRREQVSQGVRAVRRRLKAIDPSIKLTAAVLCWPDRAYLSSYQDWGGWLQEGIIDAAVVMNYSIDAKFVDRLSRQAIALKDRKDVYVGLGAYLLDKDLKNYDFQLRETINLVPDGIVLFSYDSMLKKPEMFELAKNRFLSSRKSSSIPVRKRSDVVRTER